MRKFMAFLIICLLSYTSLFAIDFRSGQSVTITVPQYQDVYIAAGTVVINAPVYGDVIVTGGTVTINDSVMQDIHVAGGTVVLHGYVGDDVRCAGGHITIDHYIEGDLIAAGGTIVMKPQSTAASVTVTAGEITFNGTSRGAFQSAAGTLTMNGKVDGNADLKGGKIFVNGNISGKANLAASRDIIISPKARIARGIRYWLPMKRPLVVPAGVSHYAPTYDSLLFITHSRWYFLGASTFLGLLWYLGMAYILILLIQYLFRTTFLNAGIKIYTKPGHSFLLGAGFLIGVPLAALLILATVVGLPISVLLLLFYFTLLFLATVISSVVIVNWVSFISNKQFSLMKMSGMGLFTFILLKIISFTPFFGSALMLVIVSMSFGAILSTINWKMIRHNKVPFNVRSIAVKVNPESANN